LSSAIAAYLARGLDLVQAVRSAKFYVAQAILSGPNLGHGPGPLNHFHRYYFWEETPPRKGSRAKAKLAAKKTMARRPAVAKKS
jgi:hypothetical protein